MGYNTSYALRAQNISREDYLRLYERLKEYQIIGYALCDVDSFNEIDEAAKRAYFDSSGECYWYDHYEDMVGISKEFPDVRFCLRGWGEDRTDVWQHYFHNGEDELCYSVIRDVDPKKILWEKEVV